MKKQLIMAALVLLSNTSFANESSHWGYGNSNGPTHWSEINPDFSLCKNGKNQSPINISGFIKAPHESLKPHYKSKVDEIVNNGHTIQINMHAGSNIKIDNTHFNLNQFHFHSPSENTINGKSFPLEGHFVHTDKNNNLVVLAVMFENGDKNTALETLWKHMPINSGEHKNLTNNITVSNLMPKNMDYYRFNGSLTTPPCSEGVRWYVFKNPIKVSKQQVDQFHETIHHANNRPVQSINARLIIE
ncbi:Carbonic anhydrase, alpha class [hydrothermal vent metagenome]|uniref:carbonic anhydrase n=1 Tax=hydrothermal vent metagenome TaxID=652676 RepID=A0A3B1A821_9ZZZZ